MSLPEFLGMIISLFALFFLVFRAIWNAMYSKKHPEEYQRQQQMKEKRRQQLMGNLNRDLQSEMQRRRQLREEEFDDEEEELQTLQASSIQAQQIQAQIHKQEQPTITAFKKHEPSRVRISREVHTRALKPLSQSHAIKQREKSRGYQLVKRSSPKDMIVLSEIIKRPEY